MAFEKVISALIGLGKVESLFDIKEEWLVDNEVRWYEFIREYVISYNELPSFDVINSKFRLKLPVPCGRFPYELKELRERNIYLKISEGIPKLIKNLRDKPAETLTEIRQLVSTIDENTPSRDVRYDQKARERFEQYRKRVGTGGVIHLSSGISAFDESFYGYYDTDLVTVAGRAGLGKTWLCCDVALSAEAVLPPAAGPILLSSNEMAHEQMTERLDTLRFKLPYTNFLKGKLNRREEIRYKLGLEFLEANPSRIIILDDVYHLDTLRQKIILYKPSFVVVDGSYMYEPQMEENWQKITFITRGLKRLAKDYRVPHFNSTQLKRGSGTKKAKSSFEAQDDFAWSSSYSQDSDTAIVAYQNPQMQYYNQIGLQFAKGRRVEPGTSIIWTRNLNSGDYNYEIELPDNSSGSQIKDDDEKISF